MTAEQIESSKRALERSEAIVHAKLKRGLGGLATIGSTAPFVGLFGTVAGILKAFQQIATQKTPGIGAVAGGISEALVTTAFGLLVAIPAVMTFNYFTNKVEAFDVEMDNSSSELIDYFIKQGTPVIGLQLAAGITRREWGGHAPHSAPGAESRHAFEKARSRSKIHGVKNGNRKKRRRQ